jgi:alpha-L-rhamnosidase
MHPTLPLSFRFFLRCLLLITLLFAVKGLEASQQQEAASKLRVSKLLCEYQENPLGIDIPQPKLGWQLLSDHPNQKQRAYQILVASVPGLLQAGKGDLWDSGRVRSTESVHVKYAGAPLKSRLQCYWKVRVWDDSGNASEWSEPGSWEMSLLDQGDWRAVWIGSGPAHEPRPASGFFKSTNELTSVSEPVKVDGRSNLLRKQIVIQKQLQKARVYVTGLGYYELTCNGDRAGDHVLNPAKSNYRQWVPYNTFDLTSQLRQGTNVLGLMLGNGWFNPYQKWWEPYRMQWFGSKRALLQLHLDYADGSSEVIISDGSWRTIPGPILNSCVFDGEEYDATQEHKSWDKPADDDQGWRPASIVESPGGQLISHVMPPIRVIEQLSPKRVTQPKPGVYVFDFGQNFAGWTRLEATGPRGTRVRLRYAEDLRPDGTLDITSNERAVATDLYVMKGGEREVYEPRFTFHGFQYVEVTGFPGVAAMTNLVGCVVHTACNQSGSFVCGNELLNRIHRATLWSQRSNLMGYPMDCPQRDERLGWFGDAMVSMEEALFNFDMPVFYREWLDGVRRNQNPTNGDISIISPRPYIPDEPDPAWSSAYPVMTWQYYLHYGDHDFLARQFEAMKRYVDYLGTQATNHILPKYWIGDWGTIVTDWKEGEPVLVGTAFYYYDAQIVAKAARVLKKNREARHYANLAANIRTAFNQAFYSRNTHQYEKGTQFSNAFPLFLGLADPADEDLVLGNILRDLEAKKGHFDVGVLGAKYLIEALTDHGVPERAFALATQTGYPSWSHMLEGGRTTLSEFWDLHGSHNHVMMGSIDAWFYRTLAGIQADAEQPGFQHIIIKPFIPSSLPFVEARVETLRGPIGVAWTQTNGNLALTVSIPVNTSAIIYVPARSTKSVSSKPALPKKRFAKGAVVYEVGSGTYKFQVTAE